MEPPDFPYGTSLTPSIGTIYACPTSENLPRPSPLPSDPTRPIYIYFVLPMGSVNSIYFFCSTPETFTDNANGYALHPSSSLSIYPPTTRVYKTSEAPTASSYCFFYMDIYMDDLLSASKGYPAQQQRVAELTIHALKYLPHPSGQGEGLRQPKKGVGQGP